MTDTFDSLRPYLADHLRRKGIDPAKRFRCLNPEHFDRNPAMGYDPRRHKAHCFACGADYDLFDLLMLEENLPTARDALALASRMYGNGSSSQTSDHSGHPYGTALAPSAARPLPTRNAPLVSRGNPDSPAARPAKQALPESEGNRQSAADGGNSEPVSRKRHNFQPEQGGESSGRDGGSRKEGADAPEQKEMIFSETMDSYRKNVSKTTYFAQRGLSEETVARFGLGYDPESDCVVLPCDDGSFVRRSVGEKRYYNEKGKASPLFQSALLAELGRNALQNGPAGEASQDSGETPPIFIVEGVFDASSLPAADHSSRPEGAGLAPSAARPLPTGPASLGSVGDPVFIVEGVFDALSCEELGFRACAMNGAGNREKIAALLEKLPETAPVILLPDHDRAGEEWASALCTRFPWLYRCPALPQGKDINEFLLADKDGAAWFLQDAVEDWNRHLPPPYDQTSALGRMSDFAAYIEAQAKRPALNTGFARLDKALDGGLYDGLYVIGAVSSLGKTAFCMQMSDQLARQGHDVLIFSLEMMAYELMARSISRETFQLDTSARRRMAKTVRGVLDGKRYPNYTGQERAHLELATARYASYASHLYFREGDHETGLDYIRAQIERHIAETGNKPVVLIDYLQIIAPVDVHFTDKQNLDRIVCSLKKLSREKELTIFAISSFNRENYNLEVSMSAFKESGGIDYSADVLMGLQARGAGSRTFNLDEEKRKDPRELELKILKNRSAAVPEPIPFRYYPAFSCFEES